MTVRPTNPTLSTIAATAGVSVATVSKVLNGRADVSERTRALVEDLLVQHDYRPPRGHRRSAVELLIDGAFANYSAAVLEGAVDAGADTGTVIVTGRLRTGRQGRHEIPPRVWARELATAGRIGVILVTGQVTTAHVDALARERVPLVLIDPVDPPPRALVSVGATNFSGGLEVTRHLLDLGHRRIAYVGGQPGSSANQARLAGFRAALEGAGVAARPDWVVCDRFFYDVGRRAADVFFTTRDRPTAVVAGSDAVALGVLEGARSHGLRAPADVSVTGFDDSGAAEMASPPLTTVRQPLREMGRMAVRTVLNLSAGEDLDSPRVELATSLVVRGSTAPPPSTTAPDL